MSRATQRQNIGKTSAVEPGMRALILAALDLIEAQITELDHDSQERVARIYHRIIDLECQATFDKLNAFLDSAPMADTQDDMAALEALIRETEGDHTHE